MKKNKIILGLIFMFSVLVSCSVEDDFESDITNDGERTGLITQESFVFGHYYGKCVGNSCIEIFKLDLENGVLLEDRADRYPSVPNFYKGDFVKFEGAVKIDARDLLRELPNELLEIKSPVIGSPDAGDWGGIYLEYSDSETRRVWFIDQNKKNTPKTLHHYIDMVNNKILEISRVNQEY